MKNPPRKKTSAFHLNNFSTTSKIVFFLLLCTATAYSVVFIDMHQVIGRQLLLNADFSDGLNHWQARENSSGEIITGNNRLILRSRDQEKSVQIFQNIPSGLEGKKLRLQATLASKNVIPGKKSWNRARLLLVQWQEELLA